MALRHRISPARPIRYSVPSDANRAYRVPLHRGFASIGWVSRTDVRLVASYAGGARVDPADAFDSGARFPPHDLFVKWGTRLGGDDTLRADSAGTLSQGGIAANIDVATGVLSHACRARSAAPEVYDRQPDTRPGSDHGPAVGQQLLALADICPELEVMD